MIVDTSALVAILYREVEKAIFIEAIHSADSCSISVANYVELSIVIERQLGSDGMKQAEMFIRRADIAIVPVTIEQGYIARQAFVDFGKGRHRASLNYGDCFAYALAKTLDMPLLFKGNDFRATDVRIAVPEEFG